MLQVVKNLHPCNPAGGISRLLTAPAGLPDNAAAAEVPQADEKSKHVLCCELLRCEEQTSVTCWPAPDPEEEPPSRHHQGRHHRGGRQGRAGRQEGHQEGAVRAQGPSAATRRSEKAVRQGIQVRLLCLK